MNDAEVPPGGDQSSLRHLNTSRVLHLLYDGVPLTINALSRVTGLSRPTVRGIVTTLLDAGLLKPDGQDAVRTGGRPAQRYAFDRNAGRLAGLRFDVDGVWARVTDLAGESAVTAHVALPADTAPQQRVDAAATLVRAQLPTPGTPLWAVGAGTPGIVDSAGTVRLSVAIPEWSGTELTRELGERLGCPAMTAKDTNLAALAEHRVGAAQGTPDILYVQMGSRLGVGVLVDGLPFTGRSGAAGEIGRHPELGWQDAPAKLFAASGSARDSAEDAGALAFARAAHGDPEARAAVDAYARALADGIGAMVLAVDPRLIVLGGGLAKAGTVVLDPIRRRLAEICYEAPPLALTALTDDVVTVGGVEAARDLVRGGLRVTVDQALSS
ncbi:ROK family transcriptional regulator [Streptomyces sp. NBC_01754]|uniref:ROK family transcriptional regulator n=1 Tax=Streptomyces sp. NBC_01754 TaxID=2975930 RepID=UPI002DDC3EF6|nr:ROK family transcriptional regulator [Streptomyces sp. NBC_01754]WSC93054.1 ROK family transcriptional regulator [Streptomyces sp. NBC_01754]